MDNKRFEIRTDLAMETAEAIMKSEEDQIDGLIVKTEYSDDFDSMFKLTKVEITKDSAAELMGKAIGKYVTLESEMLKTNEVACHEKIIKALADEISEIAGNDKDGAILVIGLGNSKVTPDSLGPKVVSKILITRHIMDMLPSELTNKVRQVCAIAPGVMGTTGLETCETVRSIVQSVKPSLVIAVDALAARKATRINATIQMSDSGINPGAGLGNKRVSLNKETLGVPVIGLGVPTVVDAATLVNDTMDLIFDEVKAELGGESSFVDALNNMDTETKYDLIKNILDPYTQNMFVTPKEVDSVIDNLSNIIANAINVSLHPGITKDDINRYI